MAELRDLLPKLDAKGERALSALGELTPDAQEALRALLVRARQRGRSDERAARARRRKERRTEDATYATAQSRMLAAFGRRAAGDLPALRALAELREQIAALERLAAAGLHAQGYSWAEIGRALDITRQSAWERLGCQGSPDTEPSSDGPAGNDAEGVLGGG